MNNTNKKFGLKRATQVRDLSEFSEKEIEELKAIKPEDMENQKESDTLSNLDDKNTNAIKIN
jgi:hypothetical protein